MPSCGSESLAVDEPVPKQKFRNRSQAVEAALKDKLQRLARDAELHLGEKRLADEGLADASVIDGFNEIVG